MALDILDSFFLTSKARQTNNVTAKETISLVRSIFCPPPSRKRQTRRAINTKTNVFSIMDGGTYYNIMLPTFTTTSQRRIPRGTYGTRTPVAIFYQLLEVDLRWSITCMYFIDGNSHHQQYAPTTKQAKKRKKRTIVLYTTVRCMQMEPILRMIPRKGISMWQSFIGALIPLSQRPWSGNPRLSKLRGMIDDDRSLGGRRDRKCVVQFRKKEIRSENAF